MCVGLVFLIDDEAFNIIDVCVVCDERRLPTFHFIVYVSRSFFN